MSNKEKSGNWFGRHKILTGILIFFGLIVVITALGGSTETSTESSNSSSIEEEQASTESQTSTSESIAKLGEPARDGKFEFVVSTVNCGQKTLGSNEFTQATAQGEYCVLNISVKNIGDEPQTLFADTQYVYNADGQKFSYDSEAIFALDDTSDIWLEEINPGNTVTGQIAYDVPAGTVLVTAELHDSSLSNGVKVSLQ